MVHPFGEGNGRQDLLDQERMDRGAPMVISAMMTTLVISG